MKITVTLSTDVTFDATKEIKEVIKKIEDAALDDEYDYLIEEKLSKLIEEELEKRNFSNFNILDTNWD